MTLYVAPLPSEVEQLLRTLDAPSRLVAHLTLVHDVAGQLYVAVARCWPQVVVDRPAVLFGAATHDIGKIQHPQELYGPGTQHETAGRALLQAQGIPPRYARFAQTHGTWPQAENITMEDLFVALADTIWKGKRNETLENAITQRIADTCGQESWHVYLELDEILSHIAEDADERLAWQEHNPSL